MGRSVVDSSATLVDQCMQWAKSRIDGQVFRPGMRLPSVRALARERGVSPFTIVETYERLVASGYIEARRGSGFYVRRRALRSGIGPVRAPDSKIDLSWLMSHMLACETVEGPGLGVLPQSWLDSAKVAECVRALGRQGSKQWLSSGTPHGYAPLRSVLQERLARLDIVVQPEQVVLTTGITHALHLVLRNWVPPGATVLTLDPCWFGALGMLAMHGAHAIGVPCRHDGPDLAILERLMREERPKLLIISSVAHNPTGISLTRPTVARILELAARYDVLVFEDDVYSDLCGGDVQRLAAADRTGRVFYAGSFSKTLAANIRVGFIAANADHARSLVDAKILTGFTTPELNERLVHKLLVEGRYARHVQRLRERIAESRRLAERALIGAGLEIFGEHRDGMFAWVNTGTDTNELAARWREQRLLLAPGSLFSPQQAPTSWMRFNVSTEIQGAVKELLRSLKNAARTATRARTLRP